MLRGDIKLVGGAPGGGGGFVAAAAGVTFASLLLFKRGESGGSGLNGDKLRNVAVVVDVDVDDGAEELVN